MTSLFVRRQHIRGVHVQVEGRGDHATDRQRDQGDDRYRQEPHLRQCQQQHKQVSSPPLSAYHLFANTYVRI